jgi:hypothetical protein
MVGRHVDPSLPDAAATIRCLLADPLGRQELDRLSGTIRGVGYSPYFSNSEIEQSEPPPQPPVVVQETTPLPDQPPQPARPFNPFDVDDRPPSHRGSVFGG